MKFNQNFLRLSKLLPADLLQQDWFLPLKVLRIGIFMNGEMDYPMRGCRLFPMTYF